ncbi:MAG: TrkH family potassium uptake protein [Pelagibacteraceae bacterium]|nr:TrkH family potassium uptake protein [Pelagibacteraceae bacterium]
MNTGLKTVFLVIGFLLIILGFFMIIPYIVEITIGDKTHTFLLSSIFSIFIGSLMVISNQTEDRMLNIKQAFMMTTFSWVAITLFASIPFMYSSLNLSFTDSFFESMSGITTTGSTILDNIEKASKGVLIWRAILQWLGGIGIIVMAITVLPLLNIGGMSLFKSEGIEFEKILPSSKAIALATTRIYFILTVICALSFWIFGMDYFDAVAHALTTISTGGFSTHSKSIGFYDSVSIETTAMIFIIAGSIPFLTYLKYLKGDKKAFFTDDQIKGFLQFVIFASIIIIIYSYFFVKESIPHNIRESVFNVVSIITGTGFTTDCGIKIFRFQIVNLFINKQIKQIIYPNGVFPIKYKNQIINEGILTSVLTFVFLYIFIYFILSALLSMTGLDFVTSVSAAATALSNVGPGLGDVIGPNGNFKSLPDLSKWYLSFAMLLGRLELFSVLVFFLPSFWRD